MKWLILIAVLCIAAGVSLVAYAITMPVYTSKAAYDRIENETWNAVDATKGNAVMNALEDEWYIRMRAIETPHKRLSDLGRGLFTAGLGCLGAIGVGVLYQRWSWMRTFKALRRIWIMLWAFQVPFAFWFYGLRAGRGDYPGWADSIMIPIMGVVLNSIVGATVSLILLSRLIKQRRFPEKISFDQPRTRFEWIRFMIFLSWLVILGVFIVNGIAYGNEGDVVTCMVASSLLLIFLSMKSTEADPSTSSG